MRRDIPSNPIQGRQIIRNFLTKFSTTLENELILASYSYSGVSFAGLGQARGGVRNRTSMVTPTRKNTAAAEAHHRDEYLPSKITQLGGVNIATNSSGVCGC